MSHWSPTRESLKAVARTPALWLAEIAWRWAFGLGSLLLVALACLQLTSSLRISDSDLRLLRGGDPFLMAGTLAGVLQDAGGRLLRIAAILVAAVTVLWTFASALGRAATLNVLLREPAIRLRSLLGLSFLRAVLTLAAIISFFGAGILAGYSMGPTTDPQRTVAQAQAVAAVFLMAGVVVVTVWAVLNWVLSLAAVVAARHRRGPINAIAEAVRASRQYLREFVAVSSWFGFWHALLLIVALVATAGVIGLAGASIVGIFVLVVITAVYFALVDFLYVARLAAYVAIIAGPKTFTTGDAEDTAMRGLASNHHNS